VLAVCCAVLLLIGTDVTAVNIALPTIHAELGGGIVAEASDSGPVRASGELLERAAAVLNSVSSSLDCSGLIRVAAQIDRGPVGAAVMPAVQYRRHRAIVVVSCGWIIRLGSFGFSDVTGADISAQ
jgi:hypothetical protein